MNYTQGFTEGTEYKSFPKFEDKILDISEVNMDDLMARIRHHALTKRLRVCGIGVNLSHQFTSYDA